MSNSSSSLFLLLFVTISSCYQNRNLILLCGLNTWEAKATLSLQTLLKVKCSKWMDQIVCGGLDVAEIIAMKVLLWTLTAYAKQFSSCLSTFQQLSGLVVPKWTFGWRTPAWPDDLAMAGRKLHHALKTLPNALYFPAYMENWLGVTFELLVLKGKQFIEMILGFGWCLWVVFPEVSLLIRGSVNSAFQTYTSDTEEGYLSLNEDPSQFFHVSQKCDISPPMTTQSIGFPNKYELGCWEMNSGYLKMLGIFFSACKDESALLILL